MKNCLREPIPEIQFAADLLNTAADNHLAGNHQGARDALSVADMPEVRAFTESMWGAKSKYVPVVPKASGAPVARGGIRMPSNDERRALHARDGFHCRFCGMPVVRAEVRQYLVKAYPELNLWAAGNQNQHAALQCMWVQYDHLTPHSRGGTNDLNNMVIACAPCNYSRMHFTLDELGLTNPLDRAPVQSRWDGLERLLPKDKRIDALEFPGQ